MPESFLGKRIEWSEEKNAWLKKKRGISFEEIAEAIETEENILDIFPHPNHERYPGQTIIVVRVAGYACAIPCVSDAEKIFLKTAYRSRRLNAIYSLSE